MGCVRPQVRVLFPRLYTNHDAMKKFVSYLLVIFSFMIFFLSPVRAQTSLQAPVNPSYSLGQVVEIREEGARQINDFGFEFQRLGVRLFSNQEIIEVILNGSPQLTENQKFTTGEQVVVAQMPDEEGNTIYSITDRYRLPTLLGILAIFFGLVVAVGRRKGIQSFLGLGITMLILFCYILPLVQSGKAPLAAIFSGTILIAVVSLYVSHGFTKRTTLALASTLITIFLVVLFSYWSVVATHMLGVGSEEALFVQFGVGQGLDLRGLLIGGIIIGALGVLDDITTAQTAAVEELKKANKKLEFKQLYAHAISIGREHIASLVNTLVLAYAGASLPLLLLLVGDQVQPLWVILNGEYLAEEIVRTLVGSTALVLAVPISTALASYVYAKNLEIPGEKWFQEDVSHKH
jgi:uncharacterized membrane protein